MIYNGRGIATIYLCGEFPIGDIRLSHAAWREQQGVVFERAPEEPATCLVPASAVDMIPPGCEQAGKMLLDMLVAKCRLGAVREHLTFYPWRSDNLFRV